MPKSLGDKAIIGKRKGIFCAPNHSSTYETKCAETHMGMTFSPISREGSLILGSAQLGALFHTSRNVEFPVDGFVLAIGD
jgi:hypothetical protein